MTGSRLKEEALGINTLYGGNRSRLVNSGSESTIQGARIWLPNIEGFFFPLVGYWMVKRDKGALYCVLRLGWSFSRRLTRKRNHYCPVIDTLTQKKEEAFPDEVGAMSDLDALVFTVNDSSFLDICTILPFTFNLILGVSTFFPSHVFLNCTVILKVSFGGLLGREDQLDYALANVFEVIVLYGFRCLISVGRYAEFDTS